MAEKTNTPPDITEATTPTPASLTVPSQGHVQEGTGVSEDMTGLEEDLDREVLGRTMPPLTPAEPLVPSNEDDAESEPTTSAKGKKPVTEDDLVARDAKVARDMQADLDRPREKSVSKKAAAEGEEDEASDDEDPALSDDDDDALFQPVVKSKGKKPQTEADLVDEDAAFARQVEQEGSPRPSLSPSEAEAAEYKKALEERNRLAALRIQEGEDEEEDEGEDPQRATTSKNARIQYPPKRHRTRVVGDEDEGDGDGELVIDPTLKYVAMLAHLELDRLPKVKTRQKFTIPDAFSYRNDEEFRQVLSTPIPLDSLPPSLRTDLPAGTTQISLVDLWLNFNQGIIDHLRPDPAMSPADARKLELVRQGVSNVLESQQDIIGRMMGTTSMGRVEKGGHLLHAGLLSTLPFLVALLPKPINGGYLGAWVAAFSRYGIQAGRRVLGGQETSATIFDSYVSSFYTYSVNASIFTIPTALRATKLTKSVPFLAGAAIYDFAVLNRLENWAGMWESLRYSGGSMARDGKVPLPTETADFIAETMPKINDTIEAIKSLRKQFEGENYRVSSGVSAQLARLISDTARLDKMFDKAIKLTNSNVVVDLRQKTLREKAGEIPGKILDTVVNLPGNIVAAPGKIKQGVKNEWALLNEVEDKLQKSIVSGLLVGTLILQVVFTSGNAALLPDFIAYLAYSAAATYSKFKSKGATLQDVQQLFSDLAAGSVVGTAYNAALFAKPEWFEPDRFPIAFAFLAGYLLLCSLTIAPLVGEWAALAFDKIFGKKTPVFAEVATRYAAHNNARIGTSGGDEDDDADAIVFPTYTLGNALNDANNIPAEEIAKFNKLIPAEGIIPGGSIGGPSDREEEGFARIEELPEDTAFGEESSIPLKPRQSTLDPMQNAASRAPGLDPTHPDFQRIQDENSAWSDDVLKTAGVEDDDKAAKKP
jgi:hypothetical protein